MFGLDKLSKLKNGKEDSDEQAAETRLIEDEAPSRELIEKYLKKLEKIFDDVEEEVRNKRVSVEHRDDIVHAQTELLKLVVELTGGSRSVNHAPLENNPSLLDVADFIEEAKSHFKYEYVVDRKVRPVTEEIEDKAVELIKLVREKPDFEYAYHERKRNSVKSHEVQSFGVPTDIDRDKLAQGEDGEQVYACGRALKAMEDVCQDPSSPLWLGIGTRNGRDVPIDKNVLFRHRAIFGQTGYGKSTLLTNDAKQLVESGAGLCFIDPKGDDSKRLMKIIPERRMDDVVWIEPGATGDYLSGFNYITIGMDPDDEGYEVARANLVEDLTKMLKMSADYWGPRMDRVAKNLITAMNMYNDKTPDSVPEMNLVDLYYILKSEASRKEFEARCAKADLHFVSDYTSEIADMSSDDLEPLLGRFQPWIENPVARRMIGFREGGVNIPKAIENNRIIIVRMGAEPREMKQMLGMAVIRRIWSHIRSRSNEAAYARKPFYLFADEFDNLALADETIPAIISESRSYRLSFNIANQYPGQLPSNVIDAITTNCDTIISFNPGDQKSARTYNTQLGLDPETLTEEVNYHVWLRTTIDSRMEKSEAFRAYVYPPHPPKRPVDEAEEGIAASLKEFGRPRRSDEETYQKLLFNGGDGLWETGIGKEIELTDDDDLIRDLEIQLRQMVPEPDDPVPNTGSSGGASGGVGGGGSGGSGGLPTGGGAAAAQQDPSVAHLETILESIFATAVQGGKEPSAYVPYKQVNPELKRRLPDDVGKSLSELSNLMEKVDEQYIERETVSGEPSIRLSARGQAKVFEQDTGSAGTGGGDKHRLLLRQAFVTFTKLGYQTWLPEQDGEELPDGVADPPIDITDVDDSLPPSKQVDQIEENRQTLREEYPAVWNLSEGDGLSIEAETSTIGKPFRMLTNLRKAKEKGQTCIFATNDMSAKKGDFAYWGKKAEKTIYKTEMGGSNTSHIVSEEITFRKPLEDDGIPRYYNSTYKYQLDEDKVALRPKSDKVGTLWYIDEETDEIVCIPAQKKEIDPDVEEIRFDSVEQIDEGDPTAVPAYYEYDQSEQEYVVNANGQRLHYPTKEEMNEQWEAFNAPLIAELMFDEMPEEGDWMLVIFPDSDNPEYDQPQIYERGECKPLFDTLGADLSMPEFEANIGDVDLSDDADDSGEEGTSETTDATDTDTDSDSNSGASVAADQATLEHDSNVGVNEGESPPATDTDDTVDNGGATGEENRPTPTNISPYDLAKNQFCEVEQGTLNSIATKTVLPKKGSDLYENIVECIGYIDKPTAQYINGPEDLADVLGNTQLDRDEIAAEAEAAQEATNQTSTPAPEASSTGTPEESTAEAGGETGTSDVNAATNGVNEALRNDLILNPEAFDSSGWTETPKISETRAREIAEALDREGVDSGSFDRNPGEYLELGGDSSKLYSQPAKYAVAEVWKEEYTSGKNVRLPSERNYELVQSNDADESTLEHSSNPQSAESEPIAADQATLEKSSNERADEDDSSVQPAPTESQLNDDSNETPVITPDENSTGEESATETESTSDTGPESEVETGGEGQRKTADKPEAEPDHQGGSKPEAQAETPTTEAPRPAENGGVKTPRSTASTTSASNKNRYSMGPVKLPNNPESPTPDTDDTAAPDARTNGESTTTTNGHAAENAVEVDVVEGTEATDASRANGATESREGTEPTTTTDAEKDAESDDHSPTPAATEAETNTESSTDSSIPAVQDREPPTFGDTHTPDTTTNSEGATKSNTEAAIDTSDTVETTVDDSPTPTDAQPADNGGTSTETTTTPAHEQTEPEPPQRDTEQASDTEGSNHSVHTPPSFSTLTAEDEEPTDDPDDDTTPEGGESTAPENVDTSTESTTEDSIW